MQEGAVLLGGFGLAHAAEHFNACCLELGDAAAGYAGIGIIQGNHHPAQARGNHRLRAGGRAAVVAAGLERHVERAAFGAITGAAQGHYFGVGFTGLAVVALAH